MKEPPSSGIRRTHWPLLLIFIEIVCLSSCSSTKISYYTGLVTRSTESGLGYFYVDSFLLSLNKGVISLSISSYSYADSSDLNKPLGKRNITRTGIYAVASSSTNNGFTTSVLDVSLAERVIINQTGDGFPELNTNGNEETGLFIDTKNWTPAMANFGYKNELEIRQCFGHPTEISVRSFPNDSSSFTDFSIIEYPAIFVPLTTGK